MTAGIVSVAPGTVALVSTGDAAAPDDANAPEVIFFADASSTEWFLDEAAPPAPHPRYAPGSTSCSAAR